MNNAVIELSDAQFDQQVMQSGASLVVVEFSDVIKVNPRGLQNASAQMDKVIDTLAASGTYADIEFYRVPIELDKTQIPVAVTRNGTSAARFDINHAPTTVFLKQGKQVGSQIVGYYLEPELIRSIENARVG